MIANAIFLSTERLVYHRLRSRFETVCGIHFEPTPLDTNRRCPEGVAVERFGGRLCLICESRAGLPEVGGG